LLPIEPLLSFLFPSKIESEDEFFDAEEDHTHGHGHAAGAHPSLISFSASEVPVHLSRVEAVEPADGSLELPVAPVESESWHSLIPEVCSED